MEKIAERNFLAPIFGATMFHDANGGNSFVTGDPKTPSVPRPVLKRFIRGLPDMLGWEKQEYEAALVMLGTFSICSRDARAVSRYTGVSLSVVKQYYQRLSDCGIWLPNGSLRAHWADPELGLKAFWRD